MWHGLTRVPMVVTGWKTTEDLGVDLTLHREDPDNYAFALGDLVEMAAAPALTLPGNADIAPAIPTGLAASLSGPPSRLTWSTVAEPDFSHFELVEGVPEAGPAAAERIAEPCTATYRRDNAPAGSRLTDLPEANAKGNLGVLLQVDLCLTNHNQLKVQAH